jgi:hypothetical protein
MGEFWDSTISSCGVGEAVFSSGSYPPRYVLSRDTRVRGLMTGVTGLSGDTLRSNAVLGRFDCLDLRGCGPEFNVAFSGIGNENLGDGLLLVELFTERGCVDSRIHLSGFIQL